MNAKWEKTTNNDWVLLVDGKPKCTLVRLHTSDWIAQAFHANGMYQAFPVNSAPMLELEEMYLGEAKGGAAIGG